MCRAQLGPASLFWDRVSRNRERVPNALASGSTDPPDSTPFDPMDGDLRQVISVVERQQISLFVITRAGLSL